MNLLHKFRVEYDRGDDTSYLTCLDHASWYAGTGRIGLDELVNLAKDHLETDHRKHVADCYCEDGVKDVRCLPTYRAVPL